MREVMDDDVDASFKERLKEATVGANPPLTFNKLIQNNSVSHILILGFPCDAQNDISLKQR